MIIQCPACRKKYKYDERRFDGASVKKIRCPGCETVFEVKDPSARVDDTTTAVRSREMMAKVREQVAVELLNRKRISLAFISGPLAGQVVQLTQPVTVIGRSQGDILLDDPECSRRHAEIAITADGIYLRDLKSTNGTFMEGIRVQEVKLQSQDEFSIGACTMMLIVRDAEGPEA